MKLRDVAGRAPLAAWTGSGNIPWNEPGFSRRMLEEHLSQAHDAASRRFETIDRHVAFIHRLLEGQPGRVLDLGCGPGLYALRLAKLGHVVRGIDFSPASLAYARAQAAAAGADCVFELCDMRVANYGDGEFDLAMMLYGEFNVFSPADARAILDKAWSALKPGGRLLLEPSNYDSTRAIGDQPPQWLVLERGLFSDNPHLRLCESGWDTAARASVVRYYVMELSGAEETTCYTTTYRAYTQAELSDLLVERGFEPPVFYPNLSGEGPPQDFLAALARKASCSKIS